MSGPVARAGPPLNLSAGRRLQRLGALQGQGQAAPGVFEAEGLDLLLQLLGQRAQGGGQQRGMGFGQVTRGRVMAVQQGLQAQQALQQGLALGRAQDGVGRGGEISPFRRASTGASTGASA